MAKTWMKNKNSKRWKQLEYTLKYMPDEFTSKDVKNFLEYKWADKGPRGRQGRVQRLHHFTNRSISIFLNNHEDVVKCNFKIKDTNVYRKRNKNVMDRKI